MVVGPARPAFKPLPRTLAVRLQTEAMADSSSAAEAHADTRPKDERLASMSPDELRTAMRTLGYRTQNDLAHAIGVSRSAAACGSKARSGTATSCNAAADAVAAQRRAF